MHGSRTTRSAYRLLPSRSIWIAFYTEILKRLTEFIGQGNEWHGIVATDSQSLLDTIMDGKYKQDNNDEPHPCPVKPLRYLNVMAPDWDITSSIVTTAQSMTGVALQYIRGHQDRTQTYEQLTLLAQLNVDADEKDITAIYV
jgi:hypothetical protein